MIRGYEPRFEDARLLTGAGRFADDQRETGAAHAVFVRSPHACADIRGVDIEAACRRSGVLAVLTAADLDRAGIGNLTIPAPVPGGEAMILPHRPALASDRVRHAGEAVAIVVAGTEAEARDAAELVAIDYAPREAVADLADAAQPGAPLVWTQAPGNVALDWHGPGSDDANRTVLDRIFAEAAYVARVALTNQRIVVAPLEPRAALAVYDAAADRFTLYCGSQSDFVMHDHLRRIMGLAPEKLRTVSGDVGGAFGMRVAPYPEYPALLLAAQATGRPVRWLATRSETFLTDNQARDTLMNAALALDGEGRFLGLRIEVAANMGAYLTSHSAFISTVNFARCLPSMYHIPRLSLRIRCLFTNTVPTGPYRGAGRPEANYCLERLIDEAARVTGVDRIELRRRNLIAPAAMPYTTPAGTRYDSGDFPAILDAALKEADVAGFAARHARSAVIGKRRGLGVGCFLEIAGGQPNEGAEITFPGASRLLLAIGVQASGQGHQTVYRRLVAERLGIPVDRVEFAQGDSSRAIPSAGSVASRSTMSVGGAIAVTVDAVIDKGRRLAAQFFEAAEADIVYRDGQFAIAGTDRRIGLFALAEHANELAGETLDTRTTADVPPSFPNGCHVAEVEIDPETGRVTLAAYRAVDDCGNVLQPVLVEGQVHGGVAQGAGQALLEAGTYDRASGQLFAGSFMDYAMPRADDLPEIASALRPVPCQTNALGVKGVGEAGTTAALAAIMNAVADALPENPGIDMPASPSRVWQAINGRTARSAEPGK
ncbi:MAG TPA: xanthine dehydrogenase family protein molybdopterin-binding subunit [Stellaceae bacterium]|nr:xanthine dehydrogenase family protein molybdopterin-binding subunit [Stellaceae bacterium]